MSDCADYYIVRPEKGKTLHPNRALAFVIILSSHHQFIIYISGPNNRLLNLKRGRHCIRTVLLLCSVAIPCIVPSDKVPSSKSTSSGRVLGTETALTWWKGMSGHSKLYVPWFADLHTDNSNMVSLSSSFIDIVSVLYQLQMSIP